MVFQTELRELLDWPAETDSHVLSLYLNIEAEWEKMISRKFETIFKALVHSMEKPKDPDLKTAFEEDVETARNFISRYQPKGRSLVLFAAGAKNFFYTKELKVHLVSQIHWRRQPFLLPLLEAREEHKHTAVVLLSKGQGKLFTFYLGEVADEQDVLAGRDVQRRRGASHDNLRSQLKLQRTVEMHVQWHLKRMVRMVEDLSRRSKFDRLVIGGVKEAADEFYDLLPPALRAKVTGRIPLPVHTREKGLEEALLRFEDQTKSNEDARLVERLIREANPLDHHCTLGFNATHNALDMDAIRTLVYSEPLETKTCRCTSCGLLSPLDCRTCETCGAAVVPFSDLLEDMARKVIRKGGEVEQVKGRAAKLLDEAGGIGAILRRAG